MKNQFWFIVTLVLFVFSSCLIYGLHKTRLTNNSLQNERQFLQKEFSSIVNKNELKYLASFNSLYECVDAGSFGPVWDDSTIFVRIHENVCLPCTSDMFDYIFTNYIISSKYNFYILGSYSLNEDFIGNIQKMGLQEIPYINSNSQLGFIGADTLDSPYLFTIVGSKISSLMVLSATSNKEIDAYFSMVERMNCQ